MASSNGEAPCVGVWVYVCIGVYRRVCVCIGVCAHPSHALVCGSV